MPRNQARGLERGQDQQQPGQRQVRPGREHRRRLDQQTGTGQLPLRGTRFGHRQHRQHLDRAGRLAGVARDRRRGRRSPPGFPAGAARAAAQRVTRTVAVLTCTAAPIAARDNPRPSSSRIRAATSSVSFLAPFGPRLPGTNPATPVASNAAVHRHSVTMPTSNAAATATAVAIFVVTSCTAASRRPTSSPAAKANVTSPCTVTSPPRPSPASKPDPGRRSRPPRRAAAGEGAG